MKICKLLLASVGVTVLLGALVSSASAGRFEISNQAIRAQWRSVSFNAPFGTTRCQLTLEGTLHARTMVKTIGSLIGYITRAILGPCPTGAATILTETLPWHVRYSGFNGTLPEITSLIVHIISVSLEVEEPRGIPCLARSGVSKPVIGTFHRNPVTHVLTELSISGRIPTINVLCFGVEGTFSSAEGVVSQSNSNTRISVSLI